MKYVVNVNDIKKNINTVKSEVGEAQIIGVLKGNGYGFGTERMAEIELECGINMFAVTEIEDAEMLRSGILKDKDILMLRSTAIPDEISRIIDCGAVATVGSPAAAKALNAYCNAKGVIGRAHIAVDSGMGRYGFLKDETDDICRVMDSSSSVDFCGIYTHFSSAFTNSEITRKELGVFLEVVRELQKRGYKTGMIHAANSSAFFNVPESRLDAVRIGSAFAGRIFGPNAEKLKKVGILETEIVEVKILPKGYKVGYNGTYTTNRDTKAAILPVGHTDGWGRTDDYELFTFKDAVFSALRGIKGVLTKKRTCVEICGKKYPIIGQIGLSHTAVDITGTDIEVGTAVQLDLSPLKVSAAVKREYI